MCWIVLKIHSDKFLFESFFCIETANADEIYPKGQEWHPVISPTGDRSSSENPLYDMISA